QQAHCRLRHITIMALAHWHVEDHVTKFVGNSAQQQVGAIGKKRTVNCNIGCTGLVAIWLADTEDRRTTIIMHFMNAVPMNLDPTLIHFDLLDGCHEFEAILHACSYARHLTTELCRYCPDLPRSS